MQISKGMADELNQTLKTLGCIFRVKWDNKDSFFNNPHLEIVPANNTFLHSAILNASDEFYSFIENYFKEKGIVLTYNNTGSIMWSESGWKDIKAGVDNG